MPLFSVFSCSVPLPLLSLSFLQMVKPVWTATALTRQASSSSGETAPMPRKTWIATRVTARMNKAVLARPAERLAELDIS